MRLPKLDVIADGIIHGLNTAAPIIIVSRALFLTFLGAWLLYLFLI
jgi:hypothetical protein